MEFKARSSTSSGLYIIAFLLFLVSVALLTLGAMNTKKKIIITPEIPVEFEKGEVQVESVSDLFQKSLLDDIEQVPDEFYMEDPFKEICASTSGDGLPAITGGTVCLR